MRRWGRIGVFGAVLVAATSLAAEAAQPGGTVLHVSSHLAKNAKVSLDGAKPSIAPGYGSTNLTAGAGHHVLKVTTAADLERVASWL